MCTRVAAPPERWTVDGYPAAFRVHHRPSLLSALFHPPFHPTRSHAPLPDLPDLPDLPVPSCPTPPRPAPPCSVLPRPAPLYSNRTLSFRWNYYFGEFEPFGYHLVNVLLHCCVAVVVAQACAVVFRG